MHELQKRSFDAIPQKVRYQLLTAGAEVRTIKRLAIDRHEPGDLHLHAPKSISESSRSPPASPTTSFRDSSCATRRVNSTFSCNQIL